MKISYLVGTLLLLLNNTKGFINRPPCLYRRMRIKYKLMFETNIKW